MHEEKPWCRFGRFWPKWPDRAFGVLADLAFWADLALGTFALLRVLADFAHSWLFGLARFALSVDLCRVEHFLRFALTKLLGERGALAETLLHASLARFTPPPSIHTFFSADISVHEVAVPADEIGVPSFVENSILYKTRKR